MKRLSSLFVALLFALPLAIPAPVHALNSGSGEVQWDWHPLYMRHTKAPTGSVVQENNWAKGGKGQTPIGFADSLVFRRGLPATRCDTTVAYRTTDFWLPPTHAFPAASARRGSAGQTGVGGIAPGSTDSMVVDSIRSMPWLAIRVVQDTLSYSYSSTTAFDSIYVAAQISYDGANWTSVSGTPTRAFSSVLITSGEDGLQPPALAATENAPGTDAAQLAIQCIPEVYVVGNAFIINRTLCMAGAYVRFLIVPADGVGQFKPEIAYWSPDGREQ